MSTTREQLGTPATKKTSRRKSRNNSQNAAQVDPRSPDADSIIVGRKKNAKPIEPRNENQKIYLRALQTGGIVGGLGAAGTGKTYMAVAAASEALSAGLVGRVIITRPVVEAGERLGFLPGDLKAKIDPYLVPVYDALNEFFGKEAVEKYEEHGFVEVVPLAYMRGRTLKRAFVILDEAQNSTEDQMYMFLTRFGEGSTYVVCGDNSQNDLGGRRTGLNYLMDIAPDLGDDCTLIQFTSDDVVRHRIVKKVLKAHEKLQARLEEK